MTKYIFCTGGVVSSIGKGVASASLGAVLEARNSKVTICKLDPYINVDPGTMSPQQHGEVFVTADGAETDLDLGHYERFLNRPMSRRNNCTAGWVYDSVIRRERRGGYLGNTVQVIPHITDEIKAFIKNSAEGFDITIIEVGGTVGDIESLPFLEAIRQLRLELPKEDTCSIHITYLPYIDSAGEFKTKPTQHSVRDLREIGIQADFLLCRTTGKRTPNASYIDKIALFANLPARNVFLLPDVQSIYELPELIAKLGADESVCKHLALKLPSPDLSEWQKCNTLRKQLKHKITIGLVGKYSNLTESYKSLVEALTHAGWQTGIDVTVKHIDAKKLTPSNTSILNSIDGILVPGGFGIRGIEGKIQAITEARKTGIPYLGICIGMQLAIVEHARNHAEMPEAASSEFDSETKYPVISTEFNSVGDMGGTMRLGEEKIKITLGTRLSEIYGSETSNERHRHRYEFNPEYQARLEKSGLVFSAWSLNGKYCEAVELPDHPWFVACQFHPEYRSVPMRTHPLFNSYVQACVSQ